MRKKKKRKKMDLFSRDKASKVFEQMKEALYQEVGSRIVSETKGNQEKANKELLKKLDNWEIEVKKNIKELVDKEWNKHL